jgi:hypothetical protein
MPFAGWRQSQKDMLLNAIARVRYMNTALPLPWA